MAEIKIEKKNNNWIWIIVAIVVIGLLIYFLAFHNNNGQTRTDRAPATSALETEQTFHLALCNDELIAADFSG